MKNIPATKEQLWEGNYCTKFPEEIRQLRRNRAKKYPNSTKMAKCSMQNGTAFRKNKYIKIADNQFVKK
jgi:hypothetical protein